MTDEARLPLDNAVHWEWQGKLTRSAGNGALFLLYLSLQQGALAKPIEFINNTVSDPDSNQAVPNAYRNPSLSAQTTDWVVANKLNQLIHAHETIALRLLNELHPQPLAITDNAKRIPDLVVQNCSLGTQKRLNGSVDNTIIEDNTLLDEVIGQTQAYNVG